MNFLYYKTLSNVLDSRARTLHRVPLFRHGTSLSLVPVKNAVTLSNVIKSAQFSCEGVVFVLHYVPLFMGGTLLSLMPDKTAVDLQLLQTRCVVIQLAMNRSRRVSVILPL